MSVTESQIQAAVRLVLGRDPACVFFRNNIGVAHIRGATVRFGVGGPGGADLIGLFRGVFVAIEIKTPTGRQSPEQRLYESLVTAKGGVYVILRSTDDASAWLVEMHRKYPAREAA